MLFPLLMLATFPCGHLPGLCPLTCPTCPVSRTLDLACPPGLFCPPGSLEPQRCPPNFYCMNGTMYSCFVNSISAENSSTSSDCTCTGGFFGYQCSQTNLTAPSVPLALNAMPMVGVSLGEVLCKATSLASSLSQVYGSNASVIQCKSGNTTVDCPNFVCPCNTTARRRLLQTTTTVSLIFQVHSAAAPTVAQLQTLVAQSLPAATVDQITVIATQPYTPAAAAYKPLSLWTSTDTPAPAASSDDTTIIIVVVVVLLVVVFVLYVWNNQDPGSAEPSINVRIERSMHYKSG